MSDFLVELGANPMARQAIKALGLPIPLPQKLKRDLNPWTERPLGDFPIVVSHQKGGVMAAILAQTLTAAGADPWVQASDQQMGFYREYGEARGRHPSFLKNGEIPQALTPHAIIYDATGIQSPVDLNTLYAVFHGWIRKLRSCGRVIIVARPQTHAKTATQSAAIQALDGFMRSLGRELGRRGSTTQLVSVAPGAEERVEPLLRFLLSYRSAYITGQRILVSDGIITAAKPMYARPLEGKVALITGASRGIGAAIARCFSREGARVLLVDLPSQEGPLSRLASELNGIPLGLDITDTEATMRISEMLAKKCDGNLDILIHNAGVTRDKTLANMPADRWEMTLNINLNAVITMTEALLPLLSNDGRIVCLSSIAGIAGNMGQTNYAASKAGIIGYIKALAPQLAERGIAVNAVAPGFIETKMTEAIPVATREVARRLCNLSQGGLPQDVAETITFLASPGAYGLTGEVIRICGGNFIGA